MAGKGNDNKHDNDNVDDNDDENDDEESKGMALCNSTTCNNKVLFEKCTHK